MGPLIILNYNFQLFSLGCLKGYNIYLLIYHSRIHINSSKIQKCYSYMAQLPSPFCAILVIRIRSICMLQTQQYIFKCIMLYNFITFREQRASMYLQNLLYQPSYLTLWFSLFLLVDLGNHLVSFSYFDMALLPPTSFVLLLSYILHSDVIELTIQLCTQCVLFNKLEEICNYIVFYIYLNNYFSWRSLFYYM